jgi:hypothetical protein
MPASASRPAAWRGCAVLLLALLPLLAVLPNARAQAPEEAPVLGIAQLSRLDLLPRFRQSVKVGSVSSYDRTGGNDDGFSGKYSFVRKEGDALVIADLKGPGQVTRIWTPTPTDDPMEFYFDGEAEPRIKTTFRELFLGDRTPFLAPVSGFGGGGFYTYLPLPYRVSCKILIRAPRVQFYQVNYATFPEGTPVPSFRPELSPLERDQLQRARKLLNLTGEDISSYVLPEGQPVETSRVRKTLEPGKTITLWETRRPGRIAGLRLSPAAAFAGKDRAFVLKIYWDGDKEPAVLAPVGDFFGYSWGEPATKSLLFGTSEKTNYIYFPMPFDRSAKIELISEKKEGSAVEVEAEVLFAALPRRRDEGKFYALWRRENPTTVGSPFTFIQTEGMGHLVGVTLQSQGLETGVTPFFEGDDQATIDGELVAHGTGSEDFFNGGWYDVPGRWDRRVSFPLSGCLDYKRPLARSGAYRLFLTDAYAYRKSLLMAIEHAPEKNAIATDYVGMSYLYSEARPTAPFVLPSLAERAVVDMRRIIYTPGWSVPIYSFSFNRATVSKKEERIGNQNLRYFSMRAEGEDVFGPHSLSFLCEMPAAGKYEVALDPVLGPEQGMVQLFQNERALGSPVDLYSATRKKGEPTVLGIMELKEGDNPVMLKLVGKHPESKGLGLDIAYLHFRRVDP